MIVLFAICCLFASRLEFSLGAQRRRGPRRSSGSGRKLGGEIAISKLSSGFLNSAEFGDN